VPANATLVSTAAGAAGSLAGWAISTLGKRVRIGLPLCICMTLTFFLQLATTDMQTPINSMAGPEIDRPTSAPPTKSLSNYNAEILPPHSASFQSSPAVASPQGAAKGNALRLGANKPSSSIAIDSLVNKLTEEFATTEGNPWGSDDLIDMNADADDWGMLAFL
jgi:SCY1-like protein 1